MYKVLSRSLPKSNRSLTKLTNIYKKILSACHISTSQQKKNAPKSHSRTTELNSHRGSRKFEVTYKTSKTSSSSGVGKTGLKFLKRSIFPEKSNEKVKIVMFSTSSSKYFYSSTVNQSKNGNKKYFKNHRALDLYKKAFEQCMKIKFNKHRLDKANNKIGWTPEPFKLNYPQELVVISDKKKKEKPVKEKKPGDLMNKQVLRLIPKKTLTVKEMAKKRKMLEQKKITNNNNSKKKMKIMYPTHIIKHKLGLSTSYHVDKSVRKKIEFSNPKNTKPMKQDKSKIEINTIEVIPLKQELNQDLVKVISAINKRREKLSEDENAQSDEAIKRLISQHPTVKKATKSAKMTINQKYNVILLKSQAKVQLKMIKPKETVEEKVEMEKIHAEEPEKVPQADASVNDIESPMMTRNQPGASSKITQHPILPSHSQIDNDDIVRYPKRLLVDKTETFDIDGICLKTKESYVAYVDEVGDTLKQIPLYQENILLKQKQAEQDKSSNDHQIPDEHADRKTNFLTETKPDNIRVTEKSEELKNNSTAHREKPPLDTSQNDTSQNVIQTENKSNKISPVESLRDYLKKLNELKNQTAVNRLNVKKYPVETSAMVENLGVKKLKMNEKKEKFEQEARDKTVVGKKIKVVESKRATNFAINEGGSETVQSKLNVSNNNVTNEDHQSEIEPLLRKLLERDREQITASERKKFKLVSDPDIIKKKSIAKRKVIIPKPSPKVEPVIKLTTSTKLPKTKKASKYLLENFKRVPVSETSNTFKKEDEKSARIRNKIYKKILQQYTYRNKTDADETNTNSIQDKQNMIKDVGRENVGPEKLLYSKNLPKTELKIRSIEVERQNFSGKDLTASTKTENVESDTTVVPQSSHGDNLQNDIKLNRKYKEKLKNLLEPANQYLEKLKEAGENQIKSFGELKTQFTNQLSGNIGKSLKMRKVSNLERTMEKLGKFSEPNSEKNRIKTHPNQLMSNTSSPSGKTRRSSDTVSSRDEILTDGNKHKYLLDTDKKIKTKSDGLKSECTSVDFDINDGILKSDQNNTIKEEPALLETFHPIKSVDGFTERKEVGVNKPERFFVVNEQIAPPRNDSGKVFDKNLIKKDVTVKETLFYILKEGEPELDDLVPDLIGPENKIDHDTKFPKEEKKYRSVLSSVREAPKYSEDYSLNNGNNNNSSLIKNNLSPDQPTEHSALDKDLSLIENEVVSQPSSVHDTHVTEYRQLVLQVERSDTNQVPKENVKSLYKGPSEDFVLLHNRPSIRKDKPPPTNPKTGKIKKDKPKSNKEMVLPPPKTGNSPKTVDNNVSIGDNEKLAKHNIRLSRYIKGGNFDAEKKNNDSSDNYMENELEDIVFNYRSKPRNDSPCKNWITILAFIEELEITYKDGSDASLIQIYEEMKAVGGNSTYKMLEFSRVIPKNEANEPVQHSAERNDFNEKEIIQPKASQELAEINPRSVLDYEGSAYSSYSNIPESTGITVHPQTGGENEIVHSEISLLSARQTNTNRTVEENQSDDIESKQIVSTTPTAESLKFSKAMKWPPKQKNLKYPFREKQKQNGDSKKNPIKPDKVNEPKLSRKKVWITQDDSNSRNMGKSVLPKLEISKNDSRPVNSSQSNLLEKNLEDWKFTNHVQQEMFSRENNLTSATKTVSVLSKTEDDNLKPVDTNPKLNKDTEIKMQNTEVPLNKYPTKEENYRYLKKSAENSGTSTAFFKEERRESLEKLQPEVDQPLKSSRHSEVSKNIASTSLIPSEKHIRTGQRSVSNCLEENLKTWKMFKLSTAEEGGKELKEENYLADSSRLLQMSKLDENDAPDNSNQLKRAHTTIIPKSAKRSYLDKVKLRPDAYDSKSTNPAGDERYNKKIAEVELTSSLPSEKNNSTAPHELRLKHRYEEIHSVKPNHISKKKSKTARKSLVDFNRPKTESHVSRRLREETENTRFSTKRIPFKKTYLSLEKTKKTPLDEKSDVPASLQQSNKSKSLEELNKIEKTNDCFSLFFRRAKEKLDNTGIEKIGDETTAKKRGDNLLNCVVTLTLPKMSSENLTQGEPISKYDAPLKGFVGNLLTIEDSKLHLEDDGSSNLKKVSEVKCCSYSKGNDGDHEICKSGDGEKASGGNNDDNDDGRGERKISKLLLKIFLPKNNQAPAEKLNTDEIQTQKKEVDVPKDGEMPGKLKTKAIIKLSKTFGQTEKYKSSKNSLEPIIRKVDNVESGKKTRVFNMEKETKNSKSGRIQSSRPAQNVKDRMDGGKNQNHPKEKTFRETLSTVQLNMIMDKYRVDTDKLQDLSEPNMTSTEIEMLETKKMREKISEAFNRSLRNNTKAVRNKLEKVNVDKALNSMRKQNKSKHTNESKTKRARRNISRGTMSDKIEHRTKQRRNESKHNISSDTEQKLRAGNDKTEIRGIAGRGNSNKKLKKQIKCIITKTKKNCLEFSNTGIEKRERAQRKDSQSMNKIKKESRIKQKVNSKYSKYCLEDQVKLIKKREAADRKVMKKRSRLSNKTNDFKSEKLSDEPTTKQEKNDQVIKKRISETKLVRKKRDNTSGNKKHSVPDIYKQNNKSMKNKSKESSSKTNILKKEVGKESNKGLLERPISLGNLNVVNSSQDDNRRSLPKYSLERQVSCYKLTPKSGQSNIFIRSEGKDSTKDQKNEKDDKEKCSHKKQQLQQKNPEVEIKSTNEKDNQNSTLIPGSIASKNKNIVSKKSAPKESSTCCTKVVVEKILPVYPTVEPKNPKKSVTKFCYQMQIPPKSIMQVLLSKPRFDVTTLSDDLRKEISSVSKKSNSKSSNLKITYIKMKTVKTDKYDESFLPALMAKESESNAHKDKLDTQKNREQILRLRYELLRKLREEFEFLKDENFNKMLQNRTEKEDNKSEFKYNLTENKVRGEEKLPKNNTEMLIKKLSEKDSVDKKGKPEKPKDDPKKKK